MTTTAWADTAYCDGCRAIRAIKRATYDGLRSGDAAIPAVLRALLVCGHRKRLVTSAQNARRLAGRAA